MFKRHCFYFSKGLKHVCFIGANFPGIFQHVFFGLKVVAYLTNEPVGDVFSTDGDPSASVPQSTAYALLDNRAFRVVARVNLPNILLVKIQTTYA